MRQKAALILSISMIVLIVKCSAQDNTYEINGLITSKTTNQTLAGVTVVDFISGRGVISDSKGKFNMSFSILPVWLKINHLGYEEQIFSISSPEQYIDSVKGRVISIELIESSIQIEEVTVTQPGIAVKFFEKDPFAIIDYQIQDSLVIALIYKNNNPLNKELLIADLKGNPISTTPFPGAQEIFKSCTGEVFVVSANNVTEINVTKSGMFCQPEIKRKYFDAFIRPIKIINDEYIVSLDRSENDQLHEYYISNMDKMEKILLHKVGSRENEFQVKSLDSRYTNINRQIISNGDISSGQLRKLNKDMDDAVFQVATNFPPVNSAVFHFRDSIILFDFHRKEIYYYGYNGKVLNQSSLKIDLDNGWTGKIHQDYYQNRFYMEFNNDQRTSLVEIDPYTGEEIRKVVLKNYRSIDHIQVVDNHIFFLQLPYFGNQFKQLYNIRI